MTIHIEIMYADFSRRRVYIDQAHTLPRTDVLFIIVSAPDTIRPRKNGYRRVLQVYGLDWYFFLRGNGKLLLHGWHDHEWVAKSEADPFADVSISPAQHFLTKPPGLPANAVVFEGLKIDDTVWLEQAIPLFDAEMH